MHPEGSSGSHGSAAVAPQEAAPAVLSEVLVGATAAVGAANAEGVAAETGPAASPRPVDPPTADPTTTRAKPIGTAQRMFVVPPLDTGNLMSRSADHPQFTRATTQAPYLASEILERLPVSRCSGVPVLASLVPETGEPSIAHRRPITF
jgi:hypothetical protein